VPFSKSAITRIQAIAMVFVILVALIGAYCVLYHKIQTPSPTVTPTPIPSPTHHPTPSASPTPPTPTPTPTPTLTPTPTPTPTSKPTPTPTPLPSPTPKLDLNWAGYIVVSNIKNPQPVVIGVSASWIVPEVNVSKRDTFSAVWIGIGGYLDKTLIQTGTEQEYVDGQVYYFAWYELLPDYLVTIHSINVWPGDTITASISLVDSVANEWAIQISDVTRAQTFKENFNYNCSKLSAEWMVERPTVNDALSTLADFGNVTLTDCRVTIKTNVGTIGTFPYVQAVMYDRPNIQLVNVSPLSYDGSSFTVNYLSR